MSLAKLREVTDNGVVFQSHIDGSRHELTPERSIEIQNLLGSDIQMQLDECISLPNERKFIEESMNLSLSWAERSRVAFENMDGPTKGRALFGIVQGGDIPEFREKSAIALSELPFEGYSVGGLAVGEPQETMLNMLDVTNPILPESKPRYLMGVGTPSDLIEAIARGIDMFDCVLPTRAGRHGLAYTKTGKINLKNAIHVEDPNPLDRDSDCPAANSYSRAYLHHLVKSNEGLASMLLTWNNLHYYINLMKEVQISIEEGHFEEFKVATVASWTR